MEYAGVYLLDNPYFLDVMFDYYIPSELRGKVKVGGFVSVPFGNANRKKIALVAEVREKAQKDDTECKPVDDICPDIMSLSPEMLGLCFFMKEHTLCTVGDAVRSMVPASALSKTVVSYRIGDGFAADGGKKSFEGLDGETLLICDVISKKGSAGFDFLKKKLGFVTESMLRRLCSEGVLVREYAVCNTADRTEVVYSLAICSEEAARIVGGEDKKYRIRAQKSLDTLSVLLECGELAESDIRSKTGIDAAALRGLCQKGILRRSERVIQSSYERAATVISKPVVLNEEQNAAFETLRSFADSKEAHGVLLHGVTGSGKTCVMLKLIDDMLARGKGVIVLLPEIALTPQSLGIFCSRYGDRVAVIHSGLGAAERFETYKKIKDGAADVIVGTRSAVFAPVHDLGLIIIDEEQEHTYKSDMNPKYHARDIARYRCGYNKAIMLLASATPSFESYKKALDGKYTLIKLTKRYGAAVLPSTVIADMREETAAGNTSPLGNLLCRQLTETYAKGEQAILFLNRRGYNNFISCRDCGATVKCPRCSVSMTYHTYGGAYDRGELRCHWCGARIPVPQTCPSCSGGHLVHMGYGTQRVQQELESLLPEARIVRMDTDTTASRDSYEKMLTGFREHKADILLGTQMVTKGHDFPDVTLVGVLLADASLYIDDYRANERTFAMLTQVIGRAGRSEKNGVAIIQTNNPDNECIRLACAQDYESFYTQEIKLRRMLVFPPYCDIALLTLVSSLEKELLRASALLSQKLSELVKGDFADVPLVVFGPFEAPVYKVENRYRMRMVIKCVLNRRSRALFDLLLADFSRSGVKGLTLSVDFNPSNL